VLLALLPGEIGGTIIPVPDEPKNVRIVLPPPISATGKVTIAGRPISEYPGNVRIYAGYEGLGKLDQYLSIDTTANRDGAFSLEGLTPGRYTVQAALDNIWLSKGVKFNVTADSERKQLKLDIPEPGAGTIIELQNAKGAPLPNRSLNVHEPDGPITRILHPRIYNTDGKGAVWIAGLTAGPHRISVSESGTQSDINVPPLSEKSGSPRRVVVKVPNSGEN
ncbi:MAG: carboxypeptidase regulatory-like domain-containing protein, partial [Planctomycetaceae bacterium]|nr:carboxypeptidase regulatory-like domain-containing protein [Planctomycetaceae bacterium]